MTIKRNIARLMLMLLFSTAFLPLFPMTAFAQASGYWEQISFVEDEDTRKTFLDADYVKSLSGGNYDEVSTSLTPCKMCGAMHTEHHVISASLPPDTLYPGQIITINVSLHTDPVDCTYPTFYSTASFSAAFGPVNGLTNYSFMDASGVDIIETDLETGKLDVSATLTMEVPAAKETQEVKLFMVYNYLYDTVITYRWVEQGDAIGVTSSVPGQDNTDGHRDGNYEPDTDSGTISAPTVLVAVLLLGGGAIIIIRLVRKKPQLPKTAKKAGPEVYDWRGNRIDENARVRQTHEQYTQANRDAQAEYDAQRRAEEAARRQHEAEQYKMIEELLHISQRLSTTTRDAAWKMNEITRGQIDVALSGKDLDPATVKRIKDGFGKLAGGKIIGMDDIPSMPTSAQLAVRAYEDAFEEVCRNETAAAVVARTISSALSGGASNTLFQVGKGFYRMKDYIDAGGDSEMGAVSYALFGEARDRAVNRLSNKVMWNLPFTPKGNSLPKKIMRDQRKRYVKQAINAADKGTVGSNDKALRFIRWVFE